MKAAKWKDTCFTCEPTSEGPESPTAGICSQLNPAISCTLPICEQHPMHPGWEAALGNLTARLEVRRPCRPGLKKTLQSIHERSQQEEASRGSVPTGCEAAETARWASSGEGDSNQIAPEPWNPLMPAYCCNQKWAVCEERWSEAKAQNKSKPQILPRFDIPVGNSLFFLFLKRKHPLQWMQPKYPSIPLLYAIQEVKRRRWAYNWGHMAILMLKCSSFARPQVKAGLRDQSCLAMALCKLWCSCPQVSICKAEVISCSFMQPGKMLTILPWQALCLLDDRQEDSVFGSGNNTTVKIRIIKIHLI